MNKDCKHCNNLGMSFPSISGSLRASCKMGKVEMIADEMRCSKDEGFAKIHKGKYCCNQAKYDAEEAYNEYFPYQGIESMLIQIERLYGIASDLQEAFDPDELSLEEFAQLDDMDRIFRSLQDMKYISESLIEDFFNIRTALNRETDPARRQLLDGRKNK